jgi:large subunit ribosomal protein L6e
MPPIQCQVLTLSQARKSIRPTKYRSSLVPGTVLILLAGRFRGKRVILLKQLSEGALLITGPFKINGVPIRRVNARYVIATSTKVDLKGVDAKALEKVSGDSYFAREKSSKSEKGDAFMKQGEKAEVCTHHHLTIPTNITPPLPQAPSNRHSVAREK